MFLAAGAGALAATAFYLKRRRAQPVGNPMVPDPAQPVELERYLGRWYEIARYENRFEKELENVTADYRLRPDGFIEVTNAGLCRAEGGARHVSVGKAKVVPDSAGAKLKVSFFGPFWGDYWVLDRGDDYSWSIVGEPTGRFLWLLARQSDPGPNRRDMLLQRARQLGYDDTLLRQTRQTD